MLQKDELMVKKHFWIQSLKKKWLNIEAQGGVRIYQTYSIQKCLFWRLPLYLLRKKEYPVYLEIVDGNETVMIIPLCKVIFKKKYESLGAINGIPFFDFVYSEKLSEQRLRFYVQQFQHYLQNAKVQISRIRTDSNTYCILSSELETHNLTFTDYVNIPLPDSYDVYYSGLSKNTRQNIRTAYNRIASASREIRYELVFAKPLKKKMLNQVLDIYCDRHLNRYQVKTSKLKRFYLKTLDFTTWYYQHHEKSVHGILYIDGKIAAFLSGVLDEIESRLLVGRLSISEEFKPFSPGILLVNETAKELIKNGIENLDLLRGGENYKKVMGGEIYQVVDFFF